jgi:ParB family transcriptional regulator, chromosome partitioning protein
MKININSIKGSKNPIRTSEDKEKMDELVQSIAQQGLIVPIKVRPDGDAYEVVYGHRRLHACKELGLAEIECIVEGVDDRSHIIQALTENVIREDMTEPDIAKSIMAMKEDYGITNIEVGKMLGWTRGKVDQFTRMMSGEVGKVIETARGQFPYHYAQEARAGAKDEALAAQVVKKAIDEGLNRNQIRKVAEAASIAETPEERKAILDTPIDNPVFDRIVKAKAKAEIEHKAVEAERHMGNTQEVKEFLDAMKAFEKAISTIMEAIDYKRISPESVQYTVNRLAKVTESINDLTIKLMEAK